MVNGKWNCCASLRRDSKASSSMKLFLSMFPLILVVVFGIAFIMSPKDREEIIDLRSEAVLKAVNGTHNANFNYSSASTPFPIQVMQTSQQFVSPLFLSLFW
jgi:hypothetical protein